MKIAFIGFGSLGEQIKAMIDSSHNGNQEIDYIYFDDNLHGQKLKNNTYRFADYIDDRFRQYQFVIALGYKHLLAKTPIIEKLKLNNRKLFSFIHPTSYVSSTAVIADGVIIYPFCLIDQSVKIDSGTILHNRVTISHDCTIGSCNYFSPNATVCGNASIGSHCFIGAGVVISNGIVIENEVVIAIGSVVTQNLPTGTNAIGNPLRLLVNKKIKLQ